MSEDPVPDDEGVVEDSEAGCEQVTITTNTDDAENEHVKIGDVAATEGNEEVLSTTSTYTKIFFSRPPSDGSLEWLRAVWSACAGAKGKDEFDVFADDWKGELGYPALLKLLKGAELKGYLAAVPSATQPDVVTHVKLFPGCLRTLEEMTKASKPRRKVRTETTVDVDGVRKHVELRSLVGSLLGGPVDVVARACQSWLQDLEVEEKDHVKRQVHIYLERFEARWGPELNQYDPALYLQVCMSLGKPQKASLNPILALPDMEAV